jgi:cell wall-associated NlpC family hydrolase
MSEPDKRLHAYRPDLAEAALHGRVDATRFTEGTLKRVAAPVAALRREPRLDAMQLSQCLCGEDVTVLDDTAGWSWVKLKRDAYVGYVESRSLMVAAAPVTHEVAVPATLFFLQPDIKSQPAQPLPLLARLAITGENGNFAEVAGGGFAIKRHLRPINSGLGDFVDVAERFLFVPYLWGGKTMQGIDCSGLLQISLQAVGQEVMRDSDMQEASLGTQLKPTEKLRRGDLVFWPGHVGIMADSETLLHANAHHMMVAIEPLSAVKARSETAGKPVRSVKRL